MPKCVKCFRLYHPDWMVVEEIRGDEVNVCNFCKVDKDTLTIVDENDNIVETVSKDQASRNYLKYLDDLSRKPKIAEVLSKAGEASRLKNI